MIEHELDIQTADVEPGLRLLSRQWTSRIR